MNTLASAWDESFLYRFPADTLTGIGLPENAKAFLRDYGLPKSAEIPYRTYVEPLPLMPTDPPFQTAKYPLLSPSPFVSDSYRLLEYLRYDDNWENPLYFAIEEGTGCIWLVGPLIQTELYEPTSWAETHRFVNSGVHQFVETLYAYQNFVAHFEPIEPPREEIDALIDALEQKWQDIDPVAMTSPKQYWLSMIEDIKAHV